MLSNTGLTVVRYSRKPVEVIKYSLNCGGSDSKYFDSVSGNSLNAFPRSDDTPEIFYRAYSNKCISILIQSFWVPTLAAHFSHYF
jgi:hypothetical protein